MAPLLQTYVLASLLAYGEGFSLPASSFQQHHRAAGVLEATKSPDELPAYVVSVYKLHKDFIPPLLRRVDDDDADDSTTLTPPVNPSSGSSNKSNGRFTALTQDDLLRPMANQATDLANKQNIDRDMYVKKDDPSSVSKTKGNNVPVDYGIYAVTPVVPRAQDDFMRPMATRAAEFAGKKGVDWGMFVKGGGDSTSAKSKGMPVDHGLYILTPKEPVQDELLRPMASIAAEFFNKKGVDWEMFVKGTETTSAKHKGMPVDYGLFIPTPKVPVQDDLLRPMASIAAEFFGKKGVDWGMFVRSSPPKQDTGNKLPVDYGLFVLSPTSSSDKHELLRPMAAEAAQFFNKKGVDFAMFEPSTTNTGATPVHPMGYQIITPSASSMRPKDDFIPTPGQTAAHPRITFFVPVMAEEFANFLSKQSESRASPLAGADADALTDPAVQMQLDFPSQRVAPPAVENEVVANRVPTAAAERMPAKSNK